MRGFIYVMSNPSFSEGLVKIGKSEFDPKVRKRELDSATGVPTPFELQYAAFVEDHHASERDLHRKLASKRPNRRREFFELSVPEAIASIRMFATIISEEVYYRSPDEVAREERRLRLLREEEARRERAEEARQRAVWDWLESVNAPIEGKRSAFLASELSEVRQKFGLIGAAATLIIYYNFSIGAAIFVGMVAGAVYFVKVGDEKVRLGQEAVKRFPLKTESDFGRSGQVSQNAKAVLRCPACRQKVRVLANKHLRIRCPRCAHSWTSRT